MATNEEARWRRCDIADAAGLSLDSYDRLRDRKLIQLASDSTGPGGAPAFATLADVNRIALIAAGIQAGLYPRASVRAVAAFCDGGGPSRLPGREFVDASRTMLVSDRQGGARVLRGDSARLDDVLRDASGQRTSGAVIVDVTQVLAGVQQRLGLAPKSNGAAILASMKQD